MTKPKPITKRYLNSILLEGQVETVDYEHDERGKDAGAPPEETLISATLRLHYPNIPIDITDLLKKYPTLGPITWKEARIVGILKDDGEYPYVQANHIERKGG